MGKKGKTKFPVIIAIRVTKKEKQKFDWLMNNLLTTKSEFLRDHIKDILKIKPIAYERTKV